MKNNKILFSSLLVCSSLAFAEMSDKPHDMTMKPGGGGMHHGIGGGMASMTEAQKEEHLKGMQEHNLKMHDLSNQILAEKDPAKKEQLKKEQLDLMKAHHMQMMEHHKGMMSPEKK